MLQRGSPVPMRAPLPPLPTVMREPEDEVLCPPQHHCHAYAPTKRNGAGGEEVAVLEDALILIMLSWEAAILAVHHPCCSSAVSSPHQPTSPFHRRVRRSTHFVCCHSAICIWRHAVEEVKEGNKLRGARHVREQWRLLFPRRAVDMCLHRPRPHASRTPSLRVCSRQHTRQRRKE